MFFCDWIDQIVESSSPKSSSSYPTKFSYRESGQILSMDGESGQRGQGVKSALGQNMDSG